MTGKTTIEWTHAPGFVGGVWNPTTGCTRVSAGCDNCYAFKLHDQRYAQNASVARAAALSGSTWGIKLARERWIKMPFPEQYDLPFSRVQLLEDRLAVPLRTKKPTCYFVDSMADLFHEDVPEEFLARVFDVMDDACWHRYLILTKRPERMRAFVAKYAKGFGAGAWPRPNIWLGTSVEDQAAADERIPHLLATPAAVRFLSCEPLLGPVDLTAHLPSAPMAEAIRIGAGTPDLHWVIVGGESGARARPMDVAWARSLRDQCRRSGISFFMKQLGSNPVGDVHPDGGALLDRSWGVGHGRDMAEWPQDLRVREWPR